MDGPCLRQSTVEAALDIRQPPVRAVPLVLASPHNGADYPRDLLAASRLDPLTLRRSEDREAWELDPTMFSDTLPSFVNAGSPRVRMGLGTIARVVASGEEIYARKLYFAEARQRVDELYYPYHQTLRGLVQETEEAFGGCLLVDCHSMPSAASMVGGQDAADIVLGDCHGTACAPQIIEAARCFLAERQFAVALNAPYSGGFTTGHYGCPQRRRHALQIEINRGLYMDERSYRRKPAFARLAADMAGLIEHLAEVMREWLACTADCRR